jgi:glycosyltransferase involved in cell wall biosynthesis
MNLKANDVKPCRILYIQMPTAGGSTVALYELARGVDRALYDPLILFLQPNSYLQRFKNAGLNTVIFDNSKSIKKRRKRKLTVTGKLYQMLVADPLLTLRIAYVIKKENIALVHQNLGMERAVMVAAMLTGTPQICHFRSFIKQLSKSNRFLSAHVTAALYTTEAIADCYLEQGIRVAKSSIVYEAIDIQKFSRIVDASYVREQFSINESTLLISNIGRITPWKGQHHFIQAVAAIIGDCPDVRVLIVGDPGNNEQDKEYLDNLYKLCKELHLQDRVIFTGNRDDVPEIMVASDLVVHSACRPEPFGLVIAESMAAGTPVIATSGGGTPEIIEDGVTGLLVPMADSRVMGQALLRLIKSEELRNSLSAAALKMVANRFTIERHVTKVQNIYRECLSTSQKRGDVSKIKQPVHDK